MKRNRREVEKRQQDIVELVREKGEVHVEDIVEAFQVSAMTVRRDLQYLDGLNLLCRTHGGAVALDRAHLVRNSSQETQYCRDSIAAFAAQFVQDGDTLFLNGSRTVLGLLEHVGTKRVSVFTNNGWALEKDFPESVQVQISGGEKHGHVLVGEYVVRNLLEQYADKTFVGCAAVYDDGEFRYDIPTEIGINEAMISRTRQGLYVLADHTKLQRRENRINSYGSCTYNCPVTLITDELADAQMVEQLRGTGIQVLLAPLS